MTSRSISCARPAKTECSAPPTTSRRTEPGARHPADVRSDRALPARSGGFTLLELLTVLTLISVLLGIGVGAFRKINLGRAMAVSQVKDSLRAARLFALEQQSSSQVDIDIDENRLIATGLTSVGNWHFEDGRGWPTPIELTGGEIAGGGAVGRCFLVPDDDAGAADLGKSVSFDGDEGFLAEVFVKIAPDMQAPVLTKGHAFQIATTSDLGVEVVVRAREKGRLGAGDGRNVTVSLARCVAADRWTRIAASYDGLSLRLYIDGRLRAEHRNEEPLPHWPDSEGRLVAGSLSPPFSGGIDEVRLAVMAIQPSEPLPEGVQFGRKETVFFDGRGRLDPTRHADPAVITLLFGESGVREVTVGLMGEIQ